MKKAGGNLFVVDENMIEFEAMNSEIKQGFLEKSNVNAVEEMMGLIEVQRQFESTQKMVRALDDTFRSAVNQLGNYR
jgi:flagellar basal-body rod protein FlgG